MEDKKFHVPISNDEFCFALALWAHAINGKMKVDVPDYINNAPPGTGVSIVFHYDNSNRNITLTKLNNNPNLLGTLAINQEFLHDPDKLVSLLLHVSILENIIKSPIYLKHIHKSHFLYGHLLEYIRTIRIPYGEETIINKIHPDDTIKSFLESLQNKYNLMVKTD